MTAEIEKALRCIPLLAPLPPECLQQIASFSMLRSIRAGETIFCQGEPSPYCFGIVTGEVAIQRVSKNRQTPPKMLSVLGVGALFGESALFEESPRAAMASARRDGQLVAILGTKMRDWIRNEPVASVPLLTGLLQNALGRLRQTSGDLSVVYGLSRIFGSEKDISDQLHAALEFLQNSLEHADLLAVYERSPYWDEFQPLNAYPETGRHMALDIKNDFAAQLDTLRQPFVIPRAQAQTLLEHFPERWKKAETLAAVPLVNRERQGGVVHGVLFIGCEDASAVFSSNLLLLLNAVSASLSEALARRFRLEEASAQARLRAARTSFSL
jgi:CRP-like cAMP-binding protein